MKDIGIFCEIYGSTRRNRILEFLLENQSIDIAIGDMARFLEISKPKAYSVMEEFERKGYVIKSRVVGKTQLYKLNKENSAVKVLLVTFKECLKLVFDEYSQRDSGRSANPRVGLVSAKRL